MGPPNMPINAFPRGDSKTLHGGRPGGQNATSSISSERQESFAYVDRRVRPEISVERDRDELKGFVFEHHGETLGNNDAEMGGSIQARPIEPSFFSHICASSAPRLNNSSHAAPVNHDDSVVTSGHNVRTLEPMGKWRCCKCKTGHEVYAFATGPHPLSALSCVCTHRSCLTCTLDGSIKRFEPISNPAVVQISEDGLKQVRFGVFCDGCGLSWRAQEVGQGRPTKSASDQICTLPKRLIKRSAHPLGRLRPSRSMMHLPRAHSAHSELSTSGSTLNLRALSKEMAKGFGKQAKGATVKFTGIQCTCGIVTAETCLCFQIVDLAQGSSASQPAAEPKAASFSSTPQDRQKGHGTPMLKLRGGLHPNPLMSNPVTAEDLV